MQTQHPRQADMDALVHSEVKDQVSKMANLNINEISTLPQHPEPVDMDALIHPELKDYFSKMAHVDITEETLPKAREYIKALAAATKAKARLITYDNIEITTKYIPGPRNPKDSPDVYVKIYKDKNDKSNTKKPGLFWIYGGGLVMGSCDQADFRCQYYAHEANCVVVNVGHRLAPENPYPAPIEDCYTALVWMRDSAEELGIDVDKIAVFGQSSGGGMVAALSLLARDRGGPKICLQLPLYPMLDHRNTTPSSYEVVDARIWNRQKNIFAWGAYLGDLAEEEVPPYASASRATDYSNLPPTFTFIGTIDTFRDETIEYVNKLTQAQVPVEFQLYPGCFHGFDLIVPNAQVSKDVTALIISALKKAFAA